MTPDMKIPINYEEASETLKKYLRLSGSPVAFRFAAKKEDIPSGMEALDKTIRHCSMIGLARKEGKIFYSTSEKHECNGGAWALGLREITESLKNGDFYYKLGKFESSASCKRTIDRVAHLHTGATYATLYAPLETLFRLGGRIQSEFAGIQSVCSDACAQTYLTGHVNFSLGCDGSRKFSGIEDGELVIGIPAELLPEITESLTVVAAAPGSKPGTK
jgi:uncharacterized protein (DUF169 family)